MNDSTYVSVGDGGPENVINLAQRVQSAGEDFRSTAQALAKAIKDIEDDEPWGKDDKYADAFRKNYMATPEGAKVPANEAVVGSVTDSGDAMARIGAAGVQAMGKYMVTDSDNASDLGSTEQKA